MEYFKNLLELRRLLRIYPPSHSDDPTILALTTFITKTEHPWTRRPSVIADPSGEGARLGEVLFHCMHNSDLSVDDRKFLSLEYFPKMVMAMLVEFSGDDGEGGEEEEGGEGGKGRWFQETVKPFVGSFGMRLRELVAAEQGRGDSIHRCCEELAVKTMCLKSA